MYKYKIILKRVHKLQIKAETKFKTLKKTVNDIK